MLLTQLLVCLFVVVGAEGGSAEGYVATGYGVDETFPIHHGLTSANSGYETYQRFISGCEARFGTQPCRQTERQRMAMNLEQGSRQRNYTELGFGRVKAPEAAYGPARRFWEAHRDEASPETWPPGNTYVNSWVAPTQMVSFEDRRFQPLGLQTKQAIWDGVKPVLEAWTGQTLKPTSLYGIRVYGPGAILNPHLDRLPLVTSAILQIDQDLDDPWPVEVVGHDGNAYNVTLQPGDMALYESHTIIHGRPHPLKGRFFANVFVHFIPADHDGRNDDGVDFDWQQEASQGKGLHKHFPEPPPTAVAMDRATRAAEETKEKRGSRPVPAPASHKEGGGKKNKNEAPYGPPSHVAEPESQDDNMEATPLHYACARGDVAAVLRELQGNPDAVNALDENLWTPLHETARHGDAAVLETLVNYGADLSLRTIGGATALYIARDNGHAAAVAYLESVGAPEVPDEL